MAPPVSPYQRALGRQVDELHPRLLAYFSAIPAGSIGRGSGVFDVVGTPRRWLWPVLWILGRQGIVFPVDARDVPFTVSNTPVADPFGRPAIDAVRTFSFARGERSMIDRIGIADDDASNSPTLVDTLGTSGSVEARLAARVVNGELHLESRATSLRFGAIRLPLPRFVAPAVALVERFDDARGQQHVRVILESPLLGKLYEYSGYFDYEISATEGTTK